jgi:DNA-binding MarR family transcriptional regulator
LNRPKSKLVSRDKVPGDKRLQAQIDQLRVRVAQLEQHKLPVYGPLSHNRFVHDLVQARRDRSALFGPELLGEPAWDILLELYVAELDRQKVLVSKVGKSSGIAETTALRWLDRLENDGWLTRVPDPSRGRRVFVMLTGRGSVAMQVYVDKQIARRSFA